MRFDYKLLQALDAVVAAQSFERAAARLAISQSAVSQRIRLLEQQLGEPLLVRSQPPVCTSRGRQLLGHYQRVALLEQELATQIDDITHTPLRLPIAVNADSLATWLLDACHPWLMNGQIELHFSVENEALTWRKMQSGEVLGAVTSRAKPVSGAQSTYLGHLTYLCVASAEFKARYFPHEAPSIAQLRVAPAIAYDQRDDMHFQYIDRFFGLKSGDYPCHTVRSSEAFVSMATAGYAYCMISRQQIVKQLASAELIDLLPEHHLSVPLYWHDWLFAGTQMKAIREHLVKVAKDWLDQ
ncbi:LysR family transcriptional regulator ArgP [Celerinatantimonas yamalensis]|uniref:LysR family transcriptional regulator ArgP n=1 Tax=Celerinatantimonas yamalensis TaxID=559956 RepID=A0ABW9G772_9GAMM